ncbi:hypothetical protein SNEBB_003703 [Seison nebaliae]|nr:hypothetical protein SNEBB_003703 [Seison nebaliae]
MFLLFNLYWLIGKVVGFGKEPILNIYSGTTYEVKENEKFLINCTTYRQEELVAEFRLYRCDDKNGKTLLDYSAIHGMVYRFDEINMTYTIDGMKKEDEGKYCCMGRNRFGSTTNWIRLKFLKMQKLHVKYFYFLFLLLLPLIFIGFIWCYRKKSSEKLSFISNLEENFNRSEKLKYRKDEKCIEQFHDSPYFRHWTTNKLKEIDREEIFNNKWVNCGSFGDIYTGNVGFNEEEMYAFKTLKIFWTKKEYNCLSHEIDIHKRLLECETRNLSPFISYGMFYCIKGPSFISNEDNNVDDETHNLISQSFPPILATGFASHGNGREFLLRKDFRNKTKDSIRLTLSVFSLQLCRAIIHRDISLRNCLIFSSYWLKLSDFGLALHEDELKDELNDGNEVIDDCDEIVIDNNFLPYRWMALECFENDKNVSHQSDLWSCAVTIWEIFNLAAQPYGELRNSEIFNYLSDGKRLELSSYFRYDEDLYHELSNCWKVKDERSENLGNLIEMLRENVQLLIS